jgi:hypothetical protein
MHLEPSVTRAADLPTVKERRDATEDARRAARFKAAEARIKKIVDGAPELTEEQLRQLSILLTPPAP